MKYLIYFFLIMCCFLSCKSDNNQFVIKEAENLSIDFRFKRLEHEFFNANSAEEVFSLFKKYPQVMTSYFETKSEENINQEFAEFVFNHYSNKHFKEFGMSAMEDYGDMADTRSKLESLFKYIKYYYPEFYVPEVNTIISGFRFDKDISFSDSLIVVSIDYFLGPDARYRPDFYQYMLNRYDKPYLPSMIALGLSQNFNKTNLKEESMLSSMIYYGKAHYFLEAVMPGVPDSLNIMYSEAQLKEAADNVDVIWAHFISKQLLFETSPRILEKYLGEAPKVNEIGSNCPGRIGRWLGWQIVKKYMQENPTVTLQELMAESDANKIFKLSKYKPRK